VSLRAHRLGCFAALIQGISSPTRFFSRRNPGGGGLLKKIQLRAIDWAITLRRWNMIIPILHVEFATAKKHRPF